MLENMKKGGYVGLSAAYSVIYLAWYHFMSVIIGVFFFFLCKTSIAGGAIAHESSASYRNSDHCRSRGLSSTPRYPKISWGTRMCLGDQLNSRLTHWGGGRGEGGDGRNSEKHCELRVNTRLKHKVLFCFIGGSLIYFE